MCLVYLYTEGNKTMQAYNQRNSGLDVRCVGYHKTYLAKNKQSDIFTKIIIFFFFFLFRKRLTINLSNYGLLKFII